MVRTHHLPLPGRATVRVPSAGSPTRMRVVLNRPGGRTVGAAVALPWAAFRLTGEPSGRLRAAV